MARTAQTACPNCGHSPIAETDERCPACFNWVRELPRFHANRVQIHNDAEQEHGDAIQGTRIGGPNLVTSAAEAYPGFSSALLVMLGLVLGASGMGVVPATGSPQAYLGLAAFDIIGGILFFAYPVVARPAVTLTAPLQLLAMLYLARTDLRLPETLALGAVPLAVLAGTSGEPGPKMRSLVFSVGIGLLVYSGVVRFGARAAGMAGALIDAPQAGFRAQLPPGFIQLGGPADLSSYVALGELDPAMKVFAFADPGHGLGGLWAIVPAGRYTAPRLAEGLAASLDASSPAATPAATELGLKVPTATFERGLLGGRVASASAFKLPDERVAVLLVAGATSEVTRVRAQLVQGAAFATPSP